MRFVTGTGLEVDHQLDRRQLLNRRISGLGALRILSAETAPCQNIQTKSVPPPILLEDGIRMDVSTRAFKPKLGVITGTFVR